MPHHDFRRKSPRPSLGNRSENSGKFFGSIVNFFLYFGRVAYQKGTRQLNTDYKVFAEEWNAESESVIVNGNRSNILLGIQERLAWAVGRFEQSRQFRALKARLGAKASEKVRLTAAF